MAVSDLPGYLQGYVFSDAEQYYDSVGQFFIDQAGYSAFEGSRAEVAVGTPQFVDVNAARGIELDNTWHIYLNSPLAWFGTCIAVYGAVGWTPSGTQSAMLLKGQASNSYSANSRIDLGYFSGQYNHRITLNASASSAQDDKGDSGIYATAFALDQRVATKRVELVDSAGNKIQGSIIGDDGIGDPMIAGTASYPYQKQIIGNLDGDPASTTAFAGGNTLTLCEMHFFSGLLTDGDTTALEAELTALEAIYG